MSHRIIIVISLLAAALFSGCAYQGLITEKRSRPVPAYESYGIDAIYNFQLRDDAGALHSQMVTPEVFASYRVGDHFDDLQPLPTHEGKEMPSLRATPPELNEVPYQPTRVMQLEPKRTTLSATTVVAKSVTHRKKVAAHSHHHSKVASKTAQSHHRSKHKSRIAQTKQHAKKRVKVSNKHRTRQQPKTVAATNV